MSTLFLAFILMTTASSYEPKEAERKKMKQQGRKIGMMVGTQTRSVPGLYMKEAGEEKYKEVAEAELKKLVEEALQ